DFADVRAQMSELQQAARAAKAAPAPPRAEAPPPPTAPQDNAFADTDADDSFVATGWVPAVGGAAPAQSQWRKYAAGAGVLVVALVAGVVVLGPPSRGPP